MSYADWRERFLEAVDQDLHPADWIDANVATGKWRFWESDRAAILARIKLYPSGAKEVHGLVAAGGLDAIKALIPLAEQWGRDSGATRASISSHPAWVRLMRNEGYEMTQATIVKVL